MWICRGVVGCGCRRRGGVEEMPKKKNKMCRTARKCLFLSCGIYNPSRKTTPEIFVQSVDVTLSAFSLQV